MQKQIQEEKDVSQIIEDLKNAATATHVWSEELSGTQNNLDFVAYARMIKSIDHKLEQLDPDVDRNSLVYGHFQDMLIKPYIVGSDSLNDNPEASTDCLKNANKIINGYVAVDKFV